MVTALRSGSVKPGPASRRSSFQVRKRSWVDPLGPVPEPVLVPGPLSASLYLFGALHALWCGAHPRLRTRLRAADARDAATVLLVPALLTELLDDLARRPGPVALRTVVVGGAHLPDAERARFARLLPDAELVEYYGSAEHSLIALRRGDGLRPVPGVELRVRDGVAWVRSPLACAGRLIGGVLEPAAEWTTVGDRVAVSADGALTVLGRDSATISCGGRLVSAEEVEAVLRGVDGVTDVLVTGVPHARLGALVTAVVEGSASLPALRAAARLGLEPGKRPRRWLVTSALPRTASGKPARARVAEQLAAGTLPAEPLR